MKDWPSHFWWNAVAGNNIPYSIFRTFPIPFAKHGMASLKTQDTLREKLILGNFKYE